MKIQLLGDTSNGWSYCHVKIRKLLSCLGEFRQVHLDSKQMVLLINCPLGFKEKQRPFLPDLGVC